MQPDLNNINPLTINSLKRLIKAQDINKCHAQNYILTSNRHKNKPLLKKSKTLQALKLLHLILDTDLGLWIRELIL